MSTILDKIWFDTEPCSATQETFKKRIAEIMAVKLKLLEKDIMKDPDGIIKINSQGQIEYIGFSENLTRLILNKVNEG